VMNPPTLTLTAPRGGAAGVVALSATGLAPAGTTVASLQLSIDGQQVASAAGPAVGFGWDTTRLPNGSGHTVSATAVDADGTSATASAQAVVENPVAPVTVAISAPAAGEVSGSVQITAAAAVDHNATLTQLSISAGGAILASGAQSPLTVSWNTAGVPDGPASIVATAADSAGNTATATVAVQVKNGAPARAGGCGSGGPAAAPLSLLPLLWALRRRGRRLA